MEEEKVKKEVLCAIYTRVSTSEGLEQEFSSLDAQRESAESYIQSQKSAGWKIHSEHYADGGFTGANTDRPALQRLMDDIKEGKINCVVVYKVDRLSRSLLDFTQLLEFFDQQNVTFVSVTQHFNTNTSMGRLTLNILLSFAQFEREIISERTRDKMGAAKRKGRFIGGRPPLGYDLDTKNHKLVLNPNEAKIVKEVFDLYLEVQSLHKVARILNEKEYKTKQFTSAKGLKFGGLQFTNSGVQLIIRNLLYTGKVKYQNELYDGQHEAIVSMETFQKAQVILDTNRREKRINTKEPTHGLLSRLLRCKNCNSAMFAVYSKKKNRKYHYYVCSKAQKRGYHTCLTRMTSAEHTENKVIELIKQILNDDAALKDILNAVNLIKPAAPPVTLSKLKEAFLINSLLWNDLFPQEKARFLRTLLKEIEYDGKTQNLSLIFNKAGIKLLCSMNFDSQKEINERLSSI